MKNNFKVLIITIILVVIIMLCLICTGCSNANENSYKLEDINGVVDYYVVKYSLMQFYSDYFQIFSEDNESKEQNISNTYTRLDTEYIEKYNLTQENLKEKLESIKESDITINQILCINNGKGVYTCFVNGEFVNNLAKEIKEFNNIINMDTNNKSYSIYLSNYYEDMKFGILKTGKRVNFNIPESIKKGIYNSYGANNITYEKYVGDVFDQIRYDMLNNPNRAYRLLDDSFKRKNFNTQEKLENYINKNRKAIFLLYYGTCKSSSKGNNIILDCMDKEDNFNVIIDLKNPVEYTYKFKFE